MKKIFFHLIMLLSFFSFASAANNIIDNVENVDVKEKSSNIKDSIKNYFSIYPVEEKYNERVSFIIRKYNLDKKAKGLDNYHKIKPYLHEIQTEKNQFENLVSKEQIKKTKTLMIVGENIYKRNSFYDKVFTFGITIMDTLIVFAALLLPILGFIYLIPLAGYSIYVILKEKTKPSISDFLIYIIICILIYIIFKVGYFYIINVYDSFNSLFMELVKALVSLAFVIFLIPIFLIYVMFVFSYQSKGFEFYPDGTIMDITVELTKIHLTNVGITVDLNKDLLLLIFKVILLLLMLKNIKLAINAIFVTTNNFIKWFFYFVAIGILFFSIYYYNLDLVRTLIQFIIEIYDLLKVK